jgi:hypothetical protein
LKKPENFGELVLPYKSRNFVLLNTSLFLGHNAVKYEAVAGYPGIECHVKNWNANRRMNLKWGLRKL